MKHYHFCENVTGKEILVCADTYEEAREIAKEVAFDVCEAECTGCWDLKYCGTVSGDFLAKCSGLPEYYNHTGYLKSLEHDLVETQKGLDNLVSALEQVVATMRDRMKELEARKRGLQEAIQAYNKANAKKDSWLKQWEEEHSTYLWRFLG